MRFENLISRISPTLLLERYYKYAFPADPEKQMYDFYVLDYLKTILAYPPDNFRDLPTDLEDSVNDTIKMLYPTLRDELLDAVYYAVVSELRHVEANSINRKHKFDEPIHAKLLKSYLKYMIYHSTTNIPAEWDILGVRKPETSEEPPSSEASESDQVSRNQSFKASKYAIKANSASIKQFVEMCEILQDHGVWDSGYGGYKWADICRGWLLLWESDEISVAGDSSSSSSSDSSKETKESDGSSSEDPKRRAKLSSAKAPSFYKKSNKKKKSGKVPMAVAIDHVYDLQHNKDTVFNKLKRYYQDGMGYAWIVNALDFKANIQSYHDLLENASGTVKSMAMPILYNRLGQTWEKHISTETPMTDQIDSRYDKISPGSYTTGELEKLIVDPNIFVTPRTSSPEQRTAGKPYKIYKLATRHGSRGFVIKGDNGKPAFIYVGDMWLLKPKSSEDWDEDQREDGASTPSSDNTPAIFKPGDMIECVTAGGTKTHVGGTYSVKAVGYTLVQIIADDGLPYWANKNRFELVDSEDEPTITKLGSPAPDKSKTLKLYPGDMVKLKGNYFHSIHPHEIYKVYKVEYDYIAHADVVTLLHPPSYQPTGGQLDLQTYNSGYFVLVKKGDDEDGGEPLPAELKVGDWVKCLKAESPTGYKYEYIAVGKSYEIVDTGDDGLRIKVLTKKGLYWYDMNLFEADPNATVYPQKTPDQPRDSSSKYPFKIGDMVKCVEDTDDSGDQYQYIKIGGVYQVVNLTTSYDNELRVMVNTPEGDFFYPIKKFELATPKKPKTRFRKGDMVKCVKDTSPSGTKFHFIKLGDICEVLKLVDFGDELRLRVQTKHGAYTYEPDVFEPVPPEEPKGATPENDEIQIGDWVKLTEHIPGNAVTIGFNYMVKNMGVNWVGFYDDNNNPVSEDKSLVKKVVFNIGDMVKVERTLPNKSAITGVEYEITEVGDELVAMSSADKQVITTYPKKFITPVGFYPTTQKETPKPVKGNRPTQKDLLNKTSKFKVGDMVKIAPNTPHAYNFKQPPYKIEEVKPGEYHTLYRLKDDLGNIRSFGGNELIPAQTKKTRPKGKFKIGDMVMVDESIPLDTIDNKKAYKIKNAYIDKQGNYYSYVIVNNYGNNMAFAEDELLPAKREKTTPKTDFKVGDFVKVKPGVNIKSVDPTKTYKIKSTDTDQSGYTVYIIFDDDGNDMWLRPDELKLVGYEDIKI